MNKRQIIIAMLCLIISVALMASWKPIQYAGAEIAVPVSQRSVERQDVMDEQTAYRYMNSFKSDFVKPTMIAKRYEFTIKGRKFIVNTTTDGSFSMEYADGSVRIVKPRQYTYVDKVKGKETEYSIASVPNGNRATLDYLYANLTYIVMFRDYDVIDRLKRYGSVELNTIVDYILNNPYKYKVQITKPSKKVTNILMNDNYNSMQHLYTVKEGQPLDPYARKIIDTSEYDNKGNPRKDLSIIKDLIKRRNYNCSSEKDTKQFLEDLSYVPTLQACPYQSFGREGDDL